MLIHPLQELNYWDEGNGTSLLSHFYFNVTKVEEPKKIAIVTNIGDIWIKGIYVIFTSLNDIEWHPKDRWMKQRLTIQEEKRKRGEAICRMVTENQRLRLD